MARHGRTGIAGALLGVLVLLPLVLLGWLGHRLMDRERESRGRRFDRLLASRLGEHARSIGGHVDRIARETHRLLDDLELAVPVLRESARRHPRIRQLFWLDAGGRLVHPSPGGSLTRSEEEFLERTRQVWRDGDLLLQQPVPERVPEGVPERLPERAPASARPEAPPVAPPGAPEPARAGGGGGPGPGIDRGWYVWYWGSGPNYLIFSRRPDGTVLGAEIDRIRLLSELVAILPDDPGYRRDRRGRPDATGGPGPGPRSPAADPGERLALVDGRGQPLYAWGGHRPGPGERPRVEVELEAPIHHLRLVAHAPAGSFEAAGGAAGALTLVSGLSSVALVLGMAAWLLRREHGREMAEARQRVNFVNRVSHELKTPLTNIRMYAELLEPQLDEDQEPARRHVSIIVSESERLSRLISNVLTFARHSRETLELHPAPGSVDDVVREGLERFRPALDAAGIRVETSLDAAGRVRFDLDAVTQILGNLVGNVEKYAAGGGWLGVRTHREGGRVVLAVSDRGPGIPVSRRERVFEPFYRLCDRVDEGTSGTGIGLTIVRELARLHGGDARIEAGESGGEGTTFVVRIEVEPCES